MGYMIDEMNPITGDGNQANGTLKSSISRPQLSSHTQAQSGSETVSVLAQVGPS